MELGASRSGELSDQLNGQLSSERFRAFVSYSHADRKVAQKLHKKIETYRLPRHLRDLKGSKSEVTGRIGRVFRDREDLPAAQDLSEAVKQALEVSEALIVLCSPDAKASPWVAKEIDLFRKLHPGRPVLAAIVRGEPDEAFPEPLTQGKEPLAADLRKEGDGWRLGFLKVIAGIAGVPLDALVQRDAQRRLRSVTAVTGGTLVALLAMIGMTIFAFQQRNEALYQQAQSGRLVDYMLTDLRDALKGVGRLDIMTDVNERAMAYYKAQDDLSDMPAESLERRAKILHAWGEDDEKRGDLDKALAKFEEAHRTTEALLEQDPDNPDRIFGHAQSEYWVGYIAFLNNNKALARSHFNKRKALALSLTKISVTNANWATETVFAFGDLCAVSLMRPKQPQQALEECQEALEQMQILYDADENDIDVVENLANRHAWMADAWLEMGRLEEAFDHRTKQQRLVDTLIEQQPDNMERVENLMRAQLSFALLLKRANKRNELRNYWLAARENADRLLQHDPKNKEWRSWSEQIQQLMK